MFETWLSLTVRWFPVIAVVVLAAIFVWRQLWRQLPFFFLYLIAALLVVATKIAAFHIGHTTYFYTYWIADLVGSVVVFLAMYEVFLRRLFTGFQKNRFYRNIFPLFAALTLVLTVLTALQAPDKRAAFQMASRGFDFTRTAVLVFFIGLMAFMGRHWPKYDLGITLGFGIQAAVALADSAVRTLTHYTPTVLGTVEFAAYNVTCVIWLITFWKPERKSLQSAEQLDPAMLEQARSWEEQLKDWIAPRRGRR
ncbi:MAG TPA: hypothetical protein VKE93_14815 [Candidatus Angelobacter sp.]|nr:hypothetical protein [Candidatus Angelobacter sp.]